MKIVHIVNRLEIGGVEVGVLSLLKNSRCFDYNIVTVKGVDPKILELLTEDELDRVHIANGFVNAIYTTFRLNPEILISSLWRAHLVSLLVRLTTPSVISRIHFAHNSRYAHFVDKCITVLSSKFADFIYCDSSRTKQWVVDVLGVKKGLEVVPMNVCFSETKKTRDKFKLKFVYFGRFAEQKDLSKAIDFISSLESTITVKYDLFGRDDGYLDYLKNKVKECGLENIVTFKPAVSPLEVEKLMHNYDFYLQTSKEEGMAISVFQSLKNGLIPVVTPVGEIGNYTRDRWNSFYLDSDNIKASANSFMEEFNSNSFYNYQIGTVCQDENYPRFDSVFFDKIRSIVTSNL